MEKIKITKEQQVKVLSDKDTSAKSEEIVLSGVSRLSAGEATTGHSKRMKAVIG